jgi:hypothetical protein
MKGYKCFYNINTKKFECENVPSEVGNYTPDGTTFWIDSYEYALVTTNNYNKHNLNEVFICKNCNQPFFLDKKEQEWFIDRGLNLPKRCYCCRKNVKK